MTICSASCQAACAVEAPGRKLLWMCFPPGQKTEQSSAESATLGDGAEVCPGNRNKGSLGSWLRSWGTCGTAVGFSCATAALEHLWGPSTLSFGAAHPPAQCKVQTHSWELP